MVYRKKKKNPAIVWFSDPTHCHLEDYEVASVILQRKDKNVYNVCESGHLCDDLGEKLAIGMPCYITAMINVLLCCMCDLYTVLCSMVYGICMDLWYNTLNSHCRLHNTLWSCFRISLYMYMHMCTQQCVYELQLVRFPSTIMHYISNVLKK